VIAPVPGGIRRIGSTIATHGFTSHLTTSA
jgi:hypothetical protein